jgi:putative transposase
LGSGDERVWQLRPVDPVYPILYIDAIRIKIRDGGVVANKAATS